MGRGRKAARRRRLELVRSRRAPGAERGKGQSRSGNSTHQGQEGERQHSGLWITILEWLQQEGRREGGERPGQPLPQAPAGLRPDTGFPPRNLGVDGCYPSTHECFLSGGRCPEVMRGCGGRCGTRMDFCPQERRHLIRDLTAEGKRLNRWRDRGP